MPGIVEKVDGRYVRHDDYAVAVAHNEYLLARLKKSDDQLAAIKADRQRRGEPVASALFSKNGNIRIWSTSKLTSHPDSIPLYAAPQPADINIDYKQMFDQMCERCDALDAKLAEYSEQPTPAAQEVDTAPRQVGEYIRALMPKEPPCDT